jgi:dihydroxy-acid dehydratase
MDLQISDAEFDKRRKAWRPREPRVKSGTLYKYSKLVADAAHGAVTDA